MRGWLRAPISVVVPEESKRFADWGSSAGDSALGDVEEPPQLAGSRLPARRAPGRVVAVVSVALLLAGVAAVRWSTLGQSPSPPSTAAASFASLPNPQGLFSRPFATVGPAGWSISTSWPASGVTDYQLTNPGVGMPESAVIPPPGTIEIQITNLSPAGAAAYLGPQAGSQTPLQLLGYFRRPQGARNIVRSVAVHGVIVAGVAAESDAYTYTYEGRRNVQTQLALRKGATVVSIEVDAAPALEPAAISALNVVLAHWVWYGPAHPAPAAPILPTPRAVAPAPSPTGQWLASGFIDNISGSFANATSTSAKSARGSSCAYAPPRRAAVPRSCASFSMAARARHRSNKSPAAPPGERHSPSRTTGARANPGGRRSKRQSATR